MIDHGEAQRQIDRSPGNALLPLSRQQALWWLLDKVYGTASCQATVRLEIQGRVDRQALRAAFERLLFRHAILRTRFIASEGRPWQYVAPALEYLPFEEQILDGRWRAEQLCRVNAQSRLSLKNGSLIRATLMGLPDHGYVLQITVHPIICDGASLNRLIRELLLFYKMGVTGVEDGSVNTPAEYLYHLSDDSEGKSGNDSENELARVAEPLEDLSNPLSFRHRGPCDTAGSPPIQHITLKFSQRLAANLQKLTEWHGLNLRAVTIGALAGLLVRWARKTDIVLGIEEQGCERSEELPLIGPLAQLLSLEIKAAAIMTLAELVYVINTAERRRHRSRHDPLRKSLEACRLGQWFPPAIPLAVCGDLNAKADDLRLIEVPGLRVERAIPERCWPCAAVSVSLDECESASQIRLHYFSDCMPHEFKEDTENHWLLALEDITADPHALVADLPPINTSEYRK